MRSFEAASVIESDAEHVWAVLQDAAAWPTWDSGVTAVDGRVVLGGTLTIRSEAAPGRAFPVTVTVLDEPRRLQLTGGMPLGLFRGVRTYTLAPGGSGATAFSVREEYTGPLLPLIWRSMPDLAPSFDRFARGLKNRVESGVKP